MSIISPISIAPMIDWTNTHFRFFMRLIVPHALLYTEMQTAGAIENNPFKALYFNPQEHPIALQLGGADPERLLACALQAEALGYDEINLNLGCPSDRVQAGRFGACLMAEPELVANCIGAIKSTVSIPVTAKTRIGIDKQDSFEFFANFVHRLIAAGCDKIIVHARKAWLHGLNPKQNRTIPPLHYDYVYQIKKELPNIPVIINGHINHMDEIITHMQRVDGVMIGRLACQNPYALTKFHHYFYPNTTIQSRVMIIKKYIDYAESQYEQGTPLSILLKPIFNIAHGLSGSKRWKEQLLQAQQSKRFNTVQDALFILEEMEAQISDICLL